MAFQISNKKYFRISVLLNLRDLFIIKNDLLFIRNSNLSEPLIFYLANLSGEIGE